MLDIVKKNTEKSLPSFSERWRPLLSVVDRTACVPVTHGITISTTDTFSVYLCRANLLTSVEFEISPFSDPK